MSRTLKLAALRRKVFRLFSTLGLILRGLFGSSFRLAKLAKKLAQQQDLGALVRLFDVLRNVLGHYERNLYELTYSTSGLAEYQRNLQEVQKANYLNDWGAASKSAEAAVQVQRKFRGERSLVRNLRILGPSITSSIGHLATTLSLAVGFRDLGLDSSESEFLVLTSGAPNPDYLQLWEEHVTLFDNEVGQGVAALVEESLWPWTQNVLFSETSRPAMFLSEALNLLHVEWYRSKRDPLLNVPPAVTRAGDDFCERLNIRPDAPVVSIHVRDSPWGNEGARNGRLRAYTKAIKHLLAEGFTVVKLGNSKSGPVVSEPGFIDLRAKGYQHSWLENYFLAKSAFAIVTSSGPMHMAWTFGVPILWTNSPELNSTIFYPDSLVIPKLIRSPEGQVLSLEELAESRFANSDSDIYHIPDSKGATGYSWVDNSESEILAGTKEMIEILKTGMKLDRSQEQAGEMLIASGLKAFTPISRFFLREHSHF